MEGELHCISVPEGSAQRLRRSRWPPKRSLNGEVAGTWLDWAQDLRAGSTNAVQPAPLSPNTQPTCKAQHLLGHR